MWLPKFLWRGVEQPFDVTRDAGFDVEERCGVSAAAQLREVRLGVALIFFPEAGGKGYVLDHSLRPEFRKTVRVLAFGTPQGVDGRDRDIVEGLRSAGAAVENARLPGIVEEIQVHLHHVLDRDEIAPLLASGVPAAALEQFHLSGLPELVEAMECDRSHALLVRLPRTIDVEVTQPGHLRRVVLPAPAHQLVEEKLRKTVDVQRFLVFPALLEYRPRSVYRRRRRIDQRHRLRLAVCQ